MTSGTVAFLSTLVLFSVLAAPARLAAHDDDEIISFDAPGADMNVGDFNGTFPAAINDWGKITGYYIDAKDVYHGFLRSRDGKFTTFEAPGADTTPGSYNGTIPTGINGFGLVSGYYADASGFNHGFLLSPQGKFTSFDVPGATGYGSFPMGINAEGAVVGYYSLSGGVFRAFVRYPDGKFETYVGPNGCLTGNSAGCYGSAAFRINVFGRISGGYEDNSGNFVGHLLVRGPDGKLFTSDVPGAGTGPYQGTGCPGCASGVNEWGAIAGIFTDAENVFHGFLRSPEGKFTTFDAPGAGSGSFQGTGCSSDCAVGINDSGAIAGTYSDANNVYHGFLRSPGGRVTTFDAPAAGTGSYQGTTCPFCGLGFNQRGAIAGSYLDANNVYHGFLRMPVDD